MRQLKRVAPLMALVILLIAVALVVAGTAGSVSIASSTFWITLAVVFLLLLAVVGVGALAARRILYVALGMARRRGRPYTQMLHETHQAVAQPGGGAAGADSVLGRLEAAERRLLASVDRSGFWQEDRLVALEERIDRLSSSVQDLITNDSHKTRRHVTEESRESVRQVESLMQLMPRVDTSTRRFPASGGFAMDADGLLTLSDLLIDYQPRRVLEVGSGVSTCWLGEFAQRTGGHVTSLDHEPVYAEKTRRNLQLLGLQDAAEVILAPLTPTVVDGKEYSWYSTAELGEVRDIDLLVVDGPPQSTGEFARYPALPQLIDRLAPRCMVLMDDFGRPEEHQILDRWLEQYPEFERFELDTLRIGGIIRRG